MADKTVTLPKGSTVKIGGIPVALKEDTEILTTEGNWRCIEDSLRSLGTIEDYGLQDLVAANIEGK